MTTSSRKMDHIRICLEKKVESNLHPFEDLTLVHEALPEIDEADIDISCRIFGRRLKAPIIISAMTGGHPQTREINVHLAEAAQELGVALGIGSQRAALEDPSQVDSFSAVRANAPDIPIVGNIGAAQLKSSGPEVLERLAEMVDADAVAVHLNFLQESIQPEGDREGRGVLKALQEAAGGSVPVIVKETGAGVSREVATKLVQAKIGVIDVSGVGGTSWSGVEAYRAERAGDEESQAMGHLFWCWGITTPASIVECRSAGADVIASGGVRSGIDVAKSIALGARLAGIALPLLGPATSGTEAVVKALKPYLRALRICMFLTGCRDLSELERAPVVITGRTGEWLEKRGLDTRRFSVYRELAR